MSRLCQAVVQCWPLSERAPRLLSTVLAALAMSGVVAVAPSAAASSPHAPRFPGPKEHYPVIRTDAPGLPGHTVLRPRDLAKLTFRMPIVVWGNGGCRNSNMEFN